MLDVTDSLLLEMPLDRWIVQSMQRVDRAKVPDLPDRIIAATALHAHVPVISRDSKIRVSGIETVW
jgi:predicted nucleic acid-binding protein